MSKDFTFRETLSAVVGNPTKKTDYDKLVENTKEIDQRLEGLPYLGEFLPEAGTETYARDAQDRIETITLTGSPAGVITIVRDDLNGGRIDYAEAVMTDPEAVTIRNTYNRDENGNITGITRTVL